MSVNFSKNSSAGFTMIEILIVMALLAIVSSFTLVMNLDDYRAYLFRNERDLLVSVLQKARSQAVNNVCTGATCLDGKPHGVHFQAGQYVIFQGDSYAARDTNQDLVVEANTNLTITYSSQDILFNRLAGQATPNNFTAQIQDTFGHSVTLAVNGEGRINY